MGAQMSVRCHADMPADSAQFQVCRMLVELAEHMRQDHAWMHAAVKLEYGNSETAAEAALHK